jgi:hypothetical protein
MYPNGIFQGLDGDIEFTIAAGGTSNEVNVDIQVVDNNGDDVEETFLLDVWLSEAETGVISSDAPSGNFTVETTGTLVYPLSATTSDHIMVMTDATGTCRLSLIDSAKLAYYICVKEPRSGRTVRSRILATTDYA